MEAISRGMFRKAGILGLAALWLAGAGAAAPAPKILVIVKAGGPLAGLGSKDIRAIYLGDKSFQGSDKILPLVNDEDALADLFIRKVLNKTRAQYLKIWNGKAFIDGLAPPQELASGQEVIRAVEQNDSAIGFVPDKNLPKNDKSLKVIYTLDADE